MADYKGFFPDSDAEYQRNYSDCDDVVNSFLQTAIFQNFKDTNKSKIDLMHEQTNLSHRFCLLVNNPFASDVKFIFEKEYIELYGHKLILSMSSPVFCAMFNDNVWKKTSDKVIITDITAEIFNELLIFIYTNKAFRLDKFNAFELMYAAHKYQIVNLETLIISFLITEIAIDNILDIYENSVKVMIAGERLTTEAIKFICKHTKSILLDDSFTLISEQTLKFILSQPELEADEYDLFMAMIKWANCACIRNGLSSTSENQRGMLNGAEKLIRFPTMSVETFEKCTNSLPMFLSNEEVADILRVIKSQNKFDSSSLSFSNINRVVVKVGLPTM